VNHVLGLVPARGGSKGVLGKNVRLLAGRPLIDYTAQAARESGVLDRVVLSTDSTEIAEVGRRCGLDVPFLRPASLAADDTPMLPVIRHAMETLAASGWMADVIVLLQPTSPLRPSGAHSGRRQSAAILERGFGRHRRRSAPPSVARLCHAD
jgi:CMP-N-acetylneuraminic acid synthetase